jgi:hypothetical protein
VNVHGHIDELCKKYILYDASGNCDDEAGEDEGARDGCDDISGHFREGCSENEY